MMSLRGGFEAARDESYFPPIQVAVMFQKKKKEKSKEKIGGQTSETLMYSCRYACKLEESKVYVFTSHNI